MFATLTSKQTSCQSGVRNSVVILQLRRLSLWVFVLAVVIAAQKNLNLFRRRLFGCAACVKYDFPLPV